MAVDADLVVGVGGKGEVVETQGMAGRKVAGDAGTAEVKVPRDEEGGVVAVAVDRRGAEFTVGAGYTAAQVFGGDEALTVSAGRNCAGRLNSGSRGDCRNGGQYGAQGGEVDEADLAIHDRGRREVVRIEGGGKQ